MANTTLTFQQKKIRNLLLTPIVCHKSLNSISLIDGTIYSGQKYIQDADPDMSDFAIGFYNCIYDNVSPILGDNNDLFSDNFAGDTMNSFNTIAKELNEESKIPWLRSYHCLANFWILPKGVGRYKKGAKGSKAATANDYMDRFLVQYIKNSDLYIKHYKPYTDTFSCNIADFQNLHFLDKSYIENDEIRIFSNGKPEAITKTMLEMLKIRAKIIAKSSKSEKLWHYFQTLNLV